MPTNELSDKFYSILEKRASKYDPIYYGDLYKMVGLDHNSLVDRKKGSQLLEVANLISGKDYMISSFAVSKGNNGPYQGFYSLAEQWGRIKPGLSEQKKADFWIEEMKRVYNKYRNNIKIINKNKIHSKEAIDLKNALEQLGVRVCDEVNDGYKHIDLTIPRAKIDIEIDGIQHLTNPRQILADLGRGYYSHKDGYDTMHIPNEMIRKYLNEISGALAEASKIRERKIHVHLN